MGDRSLDWQLLEYRAAKGDLSQADSVGAAQDSRASIWPLPTVPRSVEGGAIFRMLRSGEVHFWFEGAPELGTAVIAAPSR